MSVLLSDIKVHAAAVAPEDDLVTQIGGDIDLSKKHDFADFGGLYQVVSSSGADGSQTVTLTYRTAFGELLVDSPVQLSGLTPVSGVASIGRVMKAVKSATCAGDVALESQTAVRTGTAQGPGPATNTLQLDAGASAASGAYIGKVVRLVSGPGAGEIAYGLAYDGGTKVLTVSKAWTVAPTAATGFRLSDGAVFDRLPSEVLSVVRLFYGALAGAAQRKFYQKVFYKHSDFSASGLPVLDAEVSEDRDGAELAGADIKFALDPAVNSASDNGAGNNRQVAPAGYVFDDAVKAVPGTNLAANDRIGVWLELTVPIGQANVHSIFVPLFSGRTT